MTIRKIPDGPKWEDEICDHPDHDWPSHWCPAPGTYEKTCPGCGYRSVIYVGNGYAL